MRKNLLFLLLLVAVAATAAAQSKYTSAVLSNTDLNTSPDGTAFDKWGDNYFVAFGTHGSAMALQYFYLVDYSGYNNFVPIVPVPAPAFTCRSAEITLPPELFNLSVSDIYVIDDYAFFCGGGTKTSDTMLSAVVGWFYLPDFFSGTLHIKYLILNGVPYNSHYPRWLEHLVVYKYWGRYDVVAYGEDSVGRNEVVEIKDIVSAPTCSRVDMPFVQVSPFSNKVQIDDIFLTDTYVVMTGHDYNILAPTSIRPWYIVGKKGDVVSYITSPQVNPNFYLPNADESEGLVVGAAMEKDTFAMAYVHHDMPNQQRYVRLRVIDPDAMTNPYSQQFEVEKIETVRKMAYLPDLGSVEIDADGSVSSSFTQLYARATANYITNCLLPGMGNFCRLRVTDGIHFITSHGNQFYIQDRTASLPHSDPTCPVDKDRKVEVIQKLTPAVAIPGMSGTYNLIPAASTATVLTQTIVTDCFSYE